MVRPGVEALGRDHWGGVVQSRTDADDRPLRRAPRVGRASEGRFGGRRCRIDEARRCRQDAEHGSNRSSGDRRIRRTAVDGRRSPRRAAVADRANRVRRGGRALESPSRRGGRPVASGRGRAGRAPELDPRFCLRRQLAGPGPAGRGVLAAADGPSWRMVGGRAA